MLCVLSVYVRMNDFLQHVHGVVGRPPERGGRATVDPLKPLFVAVVRSGSPVAINTPTLYITMTNQRSGPPAPGLESLNVRSLC